MPPFIYSGTPPLIVGCATLHYPVIDQQVIGISLNLNQFGETESVVCSKPTIAVFIDMSKAFDTVDLRIDHDDKGPYSIKHSAVLKGLHVGTPTVTVRLERGQLLKPLYRVSGV